jgi:predicted enzyme related to lactoylglutathione lyase
MHRSLLALLLPVLAASACAERATTPGQPAADSQKDAPVTNPVVHFEIPVTDMDRAVAFYEDVLGYPLTREDVDGYDMAFFPRADGRYGASGALAKGDVYRPSHDGPVIYFDVADIDIVMARATARGAKVLYPKKDIGAAGFVAEFEDSEGNRIALSQPKG